MAENFHFDREFQDSIIVHFIADPDKFLCFGEVLKASYFEGSQATIVAYALLGYVKEYGKCPSWPVLKQMALETNKKLSLADDEEVLSYIARLREMDATDSEFVVKKVITFARERATLGAIRQAIDLMKENKTPDDGFVKLFQDALQVGQNLEDLGLLFHADYREVIDKITKVDYGTPTGYRQWDQIWRRGWGPGWLIVFLAPPKRFKCLEPNTLVRRFDGSLAKAKEISVGDELLGDDLNPRKVSHAGFGRGPMYRVTQSDGDSYECNDVHVLCLRSDRGFVEIEARDFHHLLSKDPSVSERYKGYKLDGTLSHLSVEPIGEGDYYGFAIDGNHRFLLGDYTVTHNTGMCLNVVLNIISPMIEGDVLYYPCEITQELAFARALTNITQKGMNYLYDNPEKFKEAAGDAIMTHAAGNLVMKGYPAGTATIQTIRNHAKMAIQKYNLKKLKAIVIDYADTVLASGTYEKEYLRQAGVYTEARALGAELGCPVIMPDRCTKEATDQRVPNMRAFQGAFAKGGIVDVAIGLCCTDEEMSQNIFRTFVFINRHGPAFQHFRGKVDPETMFIDLGQEIPYDPEDEDDKSFSKKKIGRKSDKENFAQIDE